ncbi:MAG TPA: YcgL domain-containing protein [Pseudomonadales bacterium]|nr:YcgL domain-containing protein [Pseudomonadales bacterium]
MTVAGFDKSAAGGRLVQVFRSSRKEGMYLIVDRAEGLARLPEALLGRFGRPEPSLTFMLTPERPMARAEAPVVLKAIAEQGYWLQMPPADEADGEQPPVGPWQ